MANYLCRKRRNSPFTEPASDNLEDKYQQVHDMAWSSRTAIRGCGAL